ncbi:CapA family protein [Syntrophomonas palmitatica]|uniref:CapA family protein n=1 Tax=Syntrophomonas palmitatica TaxID=402877 RepID=UPI0006D22CD6|nr:CapA family protein [Syntrophomonas palmitatica]
MKKQVGQDIKNLKNEVDLVIVSFHWGIEGENQPCSKQVELGHYAVDSGADLVLGHHPHVIQKVEKYQNKYIVYSLANFCFGGSSNPRDKDSFIFQQSFIFDEKDSLVDSSRVQIIPCSISSRQDRNDYRPTVVTGENARRINLRVGL